MWVEFRQRLFGWLIIGGKSEPVGSAEDFRATEPVLQDLHMEEVGNGNVQVGQNTGQMRVVNLKQERNMTTHIHVYREPEPPPKALISPEQREVLLMIRSLRNSESIFAFMDKTFGTKMVMDLQPSQLLRVRRHVESINKRTGNRGRNNS